jgi:hypothetical protein
VSNCKIPKLKRLKETTQNLSLYNSTIRKDIRWKLWLFECYNQTEQSANCTFFYTYKKKATVVTFLSVMVQKFILLPEAFAGPVTAWRPLIRQFT